MRIREIGPSKARASSDRPASGCARSSSSTGPSSHPPARSLRRGLPTTCCFYACIDDYWRSQSLEYFYEPTLRERIAPLTPPVSWWEPAPRRGGFPSLTYNTATHVSVSRASILGFKANFEKGPKSNDRSTVSGAALDLYLPNRSKLRIQGRLRDSVQTWGVGWRNKAHCGAD